MSEWNTHKLGIIADVRDGTHDSPKQVTHGKPLVTSHHIKQGKIDLDNAYHISLDDFEAVNKRSKVDKYDILFSMIGTVGEMALIDFEPDFAIKNVGLFKTNGDIGLAKWILYYLKSKDAQAEIDACLKGSTQQYITLGDLRRFPIALPPLPEQKAIASVLSSLDDKIDLLHRQNKTLEAIAETLFKKMFQQPSPNLSQRERDKEVQEEWKEGVLPDEFDFTMGQSPPGSSYNQEGIGMPMFQGNADFGFRFPEERVYTTEPKRLAEKFDTLISVRAPVGAQNMAKKECCIGRGVAAFRYRHKNNFYTYTYFKLRSLMGEIRKFNDEGTVFGSIGKTDFQQMEIVLPPEDLIENFESEAKPLNDKVIENCNQIKLLEATRDTLLPKLMSGEVRVEYEN